VETEYHGSVLAVRSEQSSVVNEPSWTLQAALRTLVSVLFLGLATSGCSARPEETLAVARWTAEVPGHPESQLTLPAHLDALLPSSPTDYVLRSKVEVPPAMRASSLTLAVAHMPAMATLEVDGSEAVPVDASPLDAYRATGPQRWRIPHDASKDGELELALHVRHRFVGSAWIDSVPVLTNHPAGGARLAAVHAFDTVSATGALAASLFVGFFYAVFFVSLRDRRRASYGWFALAALCGMPYPAFLLGLTQPVFGVYEGPFMTVSLILGSLAAMAFSRAYVGAPPPSRVWIGVFALAAVASVVSRSPFVSILVMAPVGMAVTVATTAAQGAFLVRLRRAESRGRPKPPASIYAIAFAWPVTVVLGLPDILAWVGRGEPTGGIRTACLGIMGISLHQALSLSREHLVSLKRADELNVELGERVKLLQDKHREVELLNDELRRQIAARSRELAEKLAGMDDEELVPAPALEAGTLVENRYRVIKELGTGGMGTVYEVERVADGKHLALKALIAGGDAQARARFAREAQIVANVNHPNVVSIVDLDVAKSGFIFLVMELVLGGTTLQDVRRRHRDVPWTLGVLAQVAEGIDAIHGAGITHRDLKPGNILLSRGADGRRPLVKITDFGISSLAPDGTRISVMELAAMSASSSLPDPFEVLDPFAAAEAEAAAAAASPVARSKAEAPRRNGDAARRPSPPVLERDSGLVTSARPDVMLNLEYTPEAVADTAMDVASWERPTEAGDGSAALPAGSEKAASGSPLTETGLIFGTPQYMAQELTTGTKNATRASDVFSLAIIAFEVLTGKRPFPEAPVSAKLGGRPLPVAVPFRAAGPALPLEVAMLLDKAMSHDPRARPSAKELATTLREAADKLSPR
jgi:serine/threonine protein kinase